MKKILLSLLIIFTTVASFSIGANPMNARYWVNGSGNWHDANHWSLTSGGFPGASVPDASNDVIFDNNSLGRNSIITISGEVDCNSFNWTADATTATLKGHNSDKINIHGNLFISEKLINEFEGAINFLSANTFSTIEANVPFAGNIYFNSEYGEWNLNQKLHTTGKIALISGHLNTKSFEVEAETLVLSGNKSNCKEGLGVGAVNNRADS